MGKSHSLDVEDDVGIFDTFTVPETCEHSLSVTERKSIALEYRDKASKLACSMLKKWSSYIDSEELTEIVDISLCEAASRFNSSKGASFITFLFYHLKGNLIRAIHLASRDGCISVLDEEQSKKVGTDSSSSQIMSESEAIEAVNLLQGRVSSSPEKSFFEREDMRVIAMACEKLEALEREVIYRLYFGGEQLQNIAVALGYSRCYISRIKKDAIEHLRKEVDNIYQENVTPVVTECNGKDLTRRSSSRRRSIGTVGNKKQEKTHKLLAFA